MSWLSRIFVGDDKSADSLKRDSGLTYFDQEVPEGNALCSDDACPCGLTEEIGRGSGYLYIEKELVQFRSEYPNQNDAAQAMVKMMIAGRAPAGSTYRVGPVLICGRGARLRKLDLNVAEEDAKYWWKAGKVPLSATPFDGVPDKVVKDPSPGFCTPWKPIE